MKVIFLDIDGVLNDSKTFEDIYNEYQITKTRRLEIDREKLEYLKRIVEETQALIVLSSSWRLMGILKNGQVIKGTEKFYALIKMFQEYGLKIYDVTPYIEGKRNEEIKAWLKNKDVENFIIIDDEVYYLQEFKEHLIKTSNVKDKRNIRNIYDCSGLKPEHVEEAIRKLTLKK